MPPHEPNSGDRCTSERRRGYRLKRALGNSGCPAKYSAFLVGKPLHFHRSAKWMAELLSFFFSKAQTSIGKKKKDIKKSQIMNEGDMVCTDQYVGFVPLRFELLKFLLVI